MRSKKIKKKTSRVSFGEISLVLGTGLFFVGCFMLATAFVIWDESVSIGFTWLALAAFCCLTPFIFILTLGFGITGLIVDKKKMASILGMLLSFLYLALFFASYAEMIKGG